MSEKITEKNQEEIILFYFIASHLMLFADFLETVFYYIRTLLRYSIIYHEYLKILTSIFPRDSLTKTLMDLRKKSFIETKCSDITSEISEQYFQIG